MQEWRENRDKLVSGLEMILKKKDVEIKELKKVLSNGEVSVSLPFLPYRGYPNPRRHSQHILINSLSLFCKKKKDDSGLIQYW